MGFQKSNIGFSMADILGLLKLTIRHERAQSVDVDCPFCGKKAKMNINLIRNIYRCNYCDDGEAGSKSHGGMLQLYAAVMGLNTLSDAYTEIHERLHLNDGSNLPSHGKLEQHISIVPQPNMAPIEERNKTYRYLFSLLSLNQYHQENLIRRGLNENQIELYGYKSTPVGGIGELAEKIIAGGYRVDGIPGFYRNNYGKWMIRFSKIVSGILIPILDIKGRIQAAQIRLDRPFDKHKYMWLSSSQLPSGVSSGSPVHFVGNPNAKTMIFTEGALKGTTCHCLTGHTLLCNAGANQSENIIRLFPILKANGVEELQSGYDMDWVTNEHVRRGCIKILNAASEYGFRAKRRQWNPINKGIDDMAWANKLHALMLNRISHHCAGNVGAETKSWLLTNFRVQPFCSDMLVYLYFDTTDSYLAEKAYAMQGQPFQQLIVEIEKDMERSFYGRNF